MTLYVTQKELHLFIQDPEFRTGSLFASGSACGYNTHPFIFNICFSSLSFSYVISPELRTLGSQSFYTEWDTESGWLNESEARTYRHAGMGWNPRLLWLGWGCCRFKSPWAVTPGWGYAAWGRTWCPLLGAWCWPSSRRWETGSAAAGWSLLASRTPSPGRWRSCSAGQESKGNN